MNLKTELNKNLTFAQEQQAAARAQEAAERLARKEANIKNGTEEALLRIPEIEGKIKELSKAGSRSYSTSIYQWSRDDDLSDYQQAYLDTLWNHFQKEGLNLSTKSDCMEPTGSDPLFYHTVYSLDLVIEW